MPVDDRDERSTGAEQTDESAATGGTAAAAGASAPAPAPAGRRRRYITWHNALIVALVAVVGVFLLLLVAFFLYRTGRVDAVISDQIVSTLAEYGIRAEIRQFHTRLGARTAEIKGLELYDASSGAQLGRIDTIIATVRIEDLYALKLSRNVNLEALEVDNPELWYTVDEQGRSNFDNLHLPPPEPNQRILFSYSTAQVKVNNAVIHYEIKNASTDQHTGEVTRHVFSGAARNLRAVIQPDNPNAPAASWMNTVDLSMTDSTFTLDGNELRPIDVSVHARVNETRAEISDLTLRSPVAESHLQGTLDDWRAGRYQLQIHSTVDLTQISDTFKPATPLRGAGVFDGTLTGEGTHYKVEGEIKSDALAAGDVRLRGLQLNATANGVGAEQYDAQGRAVAEMLTAGSFNLNLLQLRGGVMGTGTDFRFIGELRAAAVRSGESSIANLMLADAVAESRAGEFNASAGRATAGALTSGATRVSGIQANGIRINAKDANNFNASVASVTTGAITNGRDTKINGVSARNITATGHGGLTAVATNDVHVQGGALMGAQVGSLNIAGVRLAIYDNGRVQGSTSDINVGTVAFNRAGTKGQVNNVRAAHPVFVLEPASRYRITADLSLGGGMLGDFQLGAARSAVVATNDEIQLNNFTADALNGHARGNAAINMGRGPSRVNASFEGLDIGGLVTLLTGNAVPVAGATTGTVDLRFPGTDFKLASGSLNAQLSGETGTATGGRTPITGALTLTADRGNFQISRADLQAGATQLTATGQFSFTNDSNLQVHVASTDAGELQRIASDLVPALEDELSPYGVQLAGNLNFDGTVRGQLDNPLISGRAALGSLLVNGRDLGALTASIESDANSLRVPDGRLTQAGGGNAQFALDVPRTGKDNISVEATLNQLDIGRLFAALPNASGDENAAGMNALMASVGPTSGRIHVTGIPGAMSGNADLTVGPGVLRNEPFDQIALKATFNGDAVSLDTLDAHFRAGRVTANGSFGLGILTAGTHGSSANKNTQFNLNVRGSGVQLDLLTGLFGAAGVNLSGTADFTATAAGDFTDPHSYKVEVNGTGQNVAINGQPAGTLSIVGHTENERFNLQLTTGLLGQPQVVAATVDLSKEDLPTTIDTTLTNADLSQLFAAIIPSSGVRLKGRATGTLHAEGPIYGDEGFTANSLRGTAHFSQLTVQVQDVELSAVDPLIVTFSPSEITFDRTQFVGVGTNVTFGGTAALGEGGRQNFSINGDLNLRVLNSLSPNIFMAGAAHVGVHVGGTFAQPNLTGTATVTGATFSMLVQDARLTVSQISGDVRFTADRAQIDSLTGRLGGGTIAVTGGASLAGLSLAQFRLSVQGQQITVPFPQDFRSTADADLVVQGNMQTQLIRGTVNLRRAEYTKDIQLADLINRQPTPTIAEGGGEGGLTANTQLDLTVEGRDALVVRNNIADAIGSVALQVRGTIDDPLIGGRITVTRGTLNFRNDKYDLTRAYIDLPMRRDADPILNLQAESEIKGYRVLVTLTGPLSSPHAAISSDPALPEADVVSLITTGTLAATNQASSTLAQTGLGTATSLLTDAIINAPIQHATDKLFGLNRFEIDPLVVGRSGASPTARLTVGRQINRNLTLTYSTNITSDQNQVLAVEYRVSDRLSFVAQYEQGSINTLQTQNNNFSFEIRFRKRF